jgi:hypothetical protein
MLCILIAGSDISFEYFYSKNLIRKDFSIKPLTLLYIERAALF